MSDDNKPDGGPWVKLHRSFFSSDIWRDHNLSRVFLWCIGKANWKPRVWNGLLIPRGSFATGKIAGAVEVGLSSSAFFRALKALEKRTMIETKANRKFTIVSVRNYDTYQNRKLKPGPQADHKRTKVEPQADHKRTTSGHNEEVRSKSIQNRTETLRSPTPDTQMPPEATQDRPSPPAPAAAPELAQEDPSLDGRIWSDAWRPTDDPPPPPRFEIRPVSEQAVPPGVIPAYDPNRLAMSRWVVEIPDHFAEVKAMMVRPVESLPLPRSCDPGRVFEWLKPEHLLPGGNGPLNVVRWFRTQLSAEAPVFRDNQADLLFALCCHAAMKGADHRIRNRVGYFAKLCTTQTPEQWRNIARHRQAAINAMPRLVRQSSEKPRST